MTDNCCNCSTAGLSRWKISEPSVQHFVIRLDNTHDLRPRSIDELKQSFEILKYGNRNSSIENPFHINKVILDPIILHDIDTENVPSIIQWIQRQTKPSKFELIVHYENLQNTTNIILKNAFIKNYVLIFGTKGPLLKKIEIDVEGLDFR